MRIINRYFFLAACIIFSVSCQKQKTEPAGANNPSFRIVFMTDIHITPERGAPEAFQMATDTVNALAPDFVLTGGDLIMDALQATESRADSLYDLYLSYAQKILFPVYNTIGNHEVLGWEDEKKVSPENPLFGTGMYQKKIGKPYYSFEHKGWKFFVLNSVFHRSGGYTGRVDAEQLAWLKSELLKTDSLMPLVVVTHIPLLSSYTQIMEGATRANEEGLVVTNSKEVLDLFRSYNLKLVLQGHLHFLEDNFVNGIHFITGGAVCSAWWQGKRHGLEEGFLYLTLSPETISWKYVDYGWDAPPN